MADFAPRSMKRKNVKNLALNAAPRQPPASSTGNSQIPATNGNNDRDDNTLEIGAAFRLDLHAEDLIVIKELGAGNGGTVSKVQHASTKAIMARKIIHVEAKKEIRKRIVRELGIMHECNSPYIVSFYGAFMNQSGDVVMCMEYMDVGSLDAISKNFGPVRIDVLGKIAEAILGGLTYLYSAHRIMHRDIKPSNVLVNSHGQIKLCDFGVSSELENSVADTFVGTGTYMAPERIQGSAYTVKSDVWSVGLTLMELAIGKFPFASDADESEDGGCGPQGILDLLQQIVLEPSPKLPVSDAFPPILDDMIGKCLMKEPSQRPTPKELFEADSFVQAAKRTPVDLQAWSVGLMERGNRKSHLPLKHQLNVQQPQGGSSSSSATPTPTIDLPFQNLSLSEEKPSSSTSSSTTSSSTTPSTQRPHFPPRQSSSSRVQQQQQYDQNYVPKQDYTPTQDYTSTQDYAARQYPPRAAPPSVPLPLPPSRNANGTPDPPGSRPVSKRGLQGYPAEYR